MEDVTHLGQPVCGVGEVYDARLLAFLSQLLQDIAQGAVIGGYEEGLGALNRDGPALAAHTGIDDHHVDGTLGEVCVGPA